MIKKLPQYLQFILSRCLDLIAIGFLIMNFIIWHLNSVNLDVSKYRLYQQGIQILTAILLINTHRFNPKTFIKDNLVFILIFCLGLYNGLNIIIDFNGIVIDMGERSTELILEAFPTFLFLLAAYRLTDRRALNIGLGLVLILISGYAILAIGHEHFSLNTFYDFTIIETDGRHQSILYNSNALGEYAFIGIFIAFFLSLISKKLWIKLLLLLPVPVLGYALILSGSRTGLFMVIAFYVIINLYIAYLKKNSRIILVIGNLVLLAGVILAVMGYLDPYIAKIRSEMSLSGRDQIWFNSLKIINEFQFKGVGYNNFTFVYNERFRMLTSPHNMLIGMSVEFGIGALVLTLVWFGILLIKNHNAIILNKDGKYTTYLILFNGFYLTYFLGQMTEYSLLKFSSMNTLFLILQGMNFGILELIQGKKKRTLENIVLYGVAVAIFYGAYLKDIQEINEMYLAILLFLIGLTFLVYFIQGVVYVFSKLSESYSKRKKDVPSR